MSYRVSVWYQTKDDPPSVHDGLTEEQAQQAAGSFMRDMTGVGGVVALRVEQE